jgi:hypothetical protein
MKLQEDETMKFKYVGSQPAIFPSIGLEFMPGDEKELTSKQAIEARKTPLLKEVGGEKIIKPKKEEKDKKGEEK